MAILVRNGILALPAGPHRADILCDGPRIVAIGQELRSPGATVIDAAGFVVGPGLVDIHVHGGGGHSFFTADPGRIRAYASWAPRNGVTSFLVSTLGRTADETVEMLAGLLPAIDDPGAGAEPLGFHLEGPFLNPVRRGAFEPALLRPPSVDEFARFQEAALGHVRQLTIAPELTGALGVIAAASHTGCVPAMGHTDATAAEAREGFEAGVSHVTHLFNAMRPIHQREGGAAVAALLEPAVTCELICDGAHIAPDVLRAAYGLLGPARAVVVTDNLHLAGGTADHGSFGGRRVKVEGARATRDDGTIVGSVATMDQHLRNAVEFLGVNVATAFRLCATNPARVVGAGRRKGALEPGRDADLVLLDHDLRPVWTLCRGEIAWSAR